MKAVNLLPADARHAGGTLTLRGASPGTVGLLAGLALAVVVAFGYVTLANNVSERRAELTRVTAESSAAQQRAAALKPYGDLAALRTATIDHVRALAGGRYDWPVVLSRFARALPSDTTLTAFTGAMGGGTSASGAVSGPTVTLNGCSSSHQSVGKVMDRLRSATGVSDVTLQSSTLDPKASSAGIAPGGCGRAETFSLTVTLDPPAGATAATTAATAPVATVAAPAATATTAPAATPATATPATTTPAATTTAPSTTTTPGAKP